MRADEVLALLANHGAVATLIGGRVKLKGAERLPAGVTMSARDLRDEIAALLAERDAINDQSSIGDALAPIKCGASSVGGINEAAKPVSKTCHDCCICGVPAAFGEGWVLRTPESARWFCGLCNGVHAQERLMFT